MTNDEFNIIKLQLASIDNIRKEQKEYIAMSNRINELVIDCLERAIAIFQNVEAND